jgi:hypothetical protein
VSFDETEERLLAVAILAEHELARLRVDHGVGVMAAQVRERFGVLLLDGEQRQPRVVRRRSRFDAWQQTGPQLARVRDRAVHYADVAATASLQGLRAVRLRDREPCATETTSRRRARRQRRPGRARRGRRRRAAWLHLARARAAAATRDGRRRCRTLGSSRRVQRVPSRRTRSR